MSYILEKYRPTKVSDYVGNKNAIKRIHEWMKKFKEGTLPKNKQGLLFIGPPGIGKTSLASFILKEYGYEVLEFNTSDVRSKNVIKDKLDKIIFGNNVLSMMFKKEKQIGIIMDEIDGCYMGDRSGIKQIIYYFKLNFAKKKEAIVLDNFKLINPIICISNDKKKKIVDIKRYCETIYFKLPTETEIKQFIKKISVNEEINLSDKAIHKIYSKSQYDFRRILLILDLIKRDNKNNGNIGETINKFHKKNLNIDIETAVETILYKNITDLDELTRLVETDIILVPLLLFENLYDFLDKSFVGSLKKKQEILKQIIQYMYEYCSYENHFFLEKDWLLCKYLAIISALPFSLTNVLKQKSNHTVSINFTSVLGKNSAKYNIVKYKQMLAKKFNIQYFHVEKFCKMMVLKIMNVQTKEEKTKLVNYVKNSGIDKREYDKIIKIIDYTNELSTNKILTNFKKLI